jgi:hypothetical protein
VSAVLILEYPGYMGWSPTIIMTTLFNKTIILSYYIIILCDAIIPSVEKHGILLFYVFDWVTIHILYRYLII